MKILSIHFHTHDASVVLVENGKVLYAVDNERFSRRKMDARTPIEALKNCLDYCKVKILDIDEIVFTGDPPLTSLKKFIEDSFSLFVLTKGKYPFWHKKPQLVLKELLLTTGIPSYIYRYLIPYIKLRLLLRDFKGKISWVQHHFCHVSSAYYPSGWSDCLVVVVEGAGYHQSLSIWDVNKGQFKLLSESINPHSAGRFYELATLLLGFNRLRHAGKITGLAAFGNPKKAYPFVKKIARTEGLQFKLDYEKYYKLVAGYNSFKNFPEELKNVSKEDIAAAFQKRLEDCILLIIENALKTTGKKKIALAGGVVANVKLNQKIFELPLVDEIYIHPAMGDDGLALGAAFFISSQRGYKPKKLKNVYLGPDFSKEIMLKAIKTHGLKYSYEKEIEVEIAKLIFMDKIIGRFYGRMEYGPRALGNRSILCQATDLSINDWLNKRLRRTEFMPFAPVTLKEYANLCYKNLKGAEYVAKFMTITFECSKFMKKKSPAVVHIDNTARPQLITEEDNPSYYKIINEYFKLTGIPSLVNTSFNMHEEPIVCTPEDAIISFLKGNLDYLAMGNFLISREKNVSKIN